MATVVLSAASPTRPPLEALAASVAAEVPWSGDTDVRMFHLGVTPLAYCQGEFDCWVKTPGICRAKDAEADIVQAVHDARAVVLVDAVTFGGYSYTMKRAVDRLICLISPFFEKRAGLTHHEPRYPYMPAFYALGWMPAGDEGVARTWRALADANALNLLAPRVGAAVVDDRSRTAWGDAIRALLSCADVPGAAITAREPLRDALLTAARAAQRRTAPVPPQTAALVVGSAKARGTSVSEGLARALASRLERAGVRPTIFFATDFLRDERARASSAAVAAADLFVLVSPLYVDAFPALATRALEFVAATRARGAGPAAFSVIVNCGFPEPEHTRTALAIARHFADAAGYAWAGGLPLGGGGAINPALPLDAQHGPAEHVKAALELAARALAHGEGLPDDAISRMASSPMPDAVYRAMGDLGWRYQAYRNGLAQAALRARPLE
jgi:hypothetical protein